jgi:hypothetical protein
MQERRYSLCTIILNQFKYSDVRIEPQTTQNKNIHAQKTQKGVRVLREGNENHPK